MAKRRSKTAEQQAKFYEVGESAESFYAYLVASLDNGHFKQYKELYKELSLVERKSYVQWLFYGGVVNNVEEYIVNLF